MLTVENKEQEAYNLGRFVGEVKATLENIEKKMDAFTNRCNLCDERIRTIERIKNGSKRSTVGYSAGTAAVAVTLVEVFKLLVG